MGWGDPRQRSAAHFLWLPGRTVCPRRRPRLTTTTDGTWWRTNLPLSPGISAYAFSATVVGALIASQPYVDEAIAAIPASTGGGFPTTRTQVLSDTASSTNKAIQASEPFLPNQLYEVLVGAWARHIFLTIETGQYAVSYLVPDQALDLTAAPVDSPYFVCVLTMGDTVVSSFSLREQTGLNNNPRHDQQADMKMKIPFWNRPETRSADYSDAIVQALLSSASGEVQEGLTGAVEIAAGFWQRSFSSALIKGSDLIGEALAPHLGYIGRSLVEHGEAIFYPDFTGGLTLIPASSSIVTGGPEPASWRYELTLSGPTSVKTRRRLTAESVLHLYYVRGARNPWKGISSDCGGGDDKKAPG